MKAFVCVEYWNINKMASQFLMYNGIQIYMYRCHMNFSTSYKVCSIHGIEFVLTTGRNLPHPLQKYWNNNRQLFVGPESLMIWAVCRHFLWGLAVFHTTGAKKMCSCMVSHTPKYHSRSLLSLVVDLTLGIWCTAFNKVSSKGACALKTFSTFGCMFASGWLPVALC